MVGLWNIALEGELNYVFVYTVHGIITTERLSHFTTARPIKIDDRRMTCDLNDLINLLMASYLSVTRAVIGLDRVNTNISLWSSRAC